MGDKINLTVLVSTSDNYIHLLEHFKKYMDKNWGLKTEIIIACENKTTDKYHCISSGNKSWGFRNLKALDKIETDYVFWLLEDYLLTHKYTAKEMKRYLEDMDQLRMDRLQICPSGFQKYSKEVRSNKYKKIENGSNYLISMQPSIWRKDFIYEVLKPEYNPWEFEKLGTKICKSDSTYIDIDITEKPYFNLVRKRKSFSTMGIFKIIDRIINKLKNRRPYKFSKGYKKYIK